MKLLSRTAAMVAMLWISACALWGEGPRPLDPSLTFSTDRGAYSAGEDVHLFLSNHSREPLGYNLCFSVLEREMAGGWVPAEAQPRRACPTVLHLLDPGGRTRDTFPVPVRTTSGEYRLRTRVEYPETGRTEQRVTNAFRIDG